MIAKLIGVVGTGLILSVAANKAYKDQKDDKQNQYDPAEEIKKTGKVKPWEPWPINPFTIPKPTGKHEPKATTLAQKSDGKGMTHPEKYVLDAQGNPDLFTADKLQEAKHFKDKHLREPTLPSYVPRDNLSQSVSESDEQTAGKHKHFFKNHLARMFASDAFTHDDCELMD